MTNPLAELNKSGQSIWYDQMERKLITTGKLQQMIEQDDLRGLTSNPTIFEKAIGGSEDYDEQVNELAGSKSRDDIYDAVVVRDIAAAADLFRPVFDRTKGHDGFVSLEVSPLMARDTAATVGEAKRLFALLDRPNVMIKIPATAEGIPAIEEVIAAGINVNVTLIFSNDVYERVIEAYQRGLERRAEQGQPVSGIASVASFFVSRIDVQADKQIEAKLKDASGDERADLESLLGQVAIANAKLAYETFRAKFDDARFAKLRDKGAQVQRPLWASTGTKNPKYSDTYYVEALIGPDTVDTIPPATYDAFREHGKVAMTLADDVDGARDVLKRFAAHGFSLDKITEELTADGVKSFETSFDSLMSTIEARRDTTVRGLGKRVIPHLGAQQSIVDEAAKRVEKEKFVERIWKKDAKLWKDDAEHAKIIANALGWLAVVELMHGRASEMKAFAESVKGEFDHVIVLGMGGSSLCSEVTRNVFGARAGYPKLGVLDSTVPDAVLALERSLNLERTLFIVASKSGTTTEPMMFHRYFYDRVKSVKGERAGENFIAVTDPDTQLGRDAKRDNFRKIFVNPADIGGRYSALSYFGMVPAAISGVDVETLLDRALHATHVAMSPALKSNPPAMLGTIIGAMALHGRDKLTLLAKSPLDTLGLWIEQLIAESTGKEGKGVVPIAGEPQLDVTAYGDDRLFVAVRMKNDKDLDARIEALTNAGHPVIDMLLDDALDLGEIFFVWEFATAVAGALLGIDAFDQPNVQESKDNTKRILEQFKSAGKLPEQNRVGTPGVVTIYSQEGSRGPTAGGSAADSIVALLTMVSPHDYVALTEYFVESPERDRAIAEIRSALATQFHVATTTGYGPRFLHSTGQLHKGGPDSGVFMQLTADEAQDVDIPNEPFTFGVLARAQALGDFESLAKRSRRALRVHLGKDIDGGLQWLLSVVRGANAKKAAGA